MRGSTIPSGSLLLAQEANLRCLVVLGITNEAYDGEVDF